MPGAWPNRLFVSVGRTRGADGWITWRTGTGCAPCWRLASADPPDRGSAGAHLAVRGRLRRGPAGMGSRHRIRVGAPQVRGVRMAAEWVTGDAKTGKSRRKLRLPQRGVGALKVLWGTAASHPQWGSVATGSPCGPRAPAEAARRCACREPRRGTHLARPVASFPPWPVHVRPHAGRACA